MKNKGFTLIELIMTIALLSVILVISFVSINKVIDEGKKNDCNSLAGNIETAASEYVSDNRYNQGDDGILNRVTVDGNGNKILNITAKDLVDGNYLSSPIINPFNKEEINPSDIKLTITLNKNYTMKKVEIVKTDEPDLFKCGKGEN